MILTLRPSKSNMYTREIEIEKKIMINMINKWYNKKTEIEKVNRDIRHNWMRVENR